jgi:hypothetical protein
MAGVSPYGTSNAGIRETLNRIAELAYLTLAIYFAAHLWRERLWVWANHLRGDSNIQGSRSMQAVVSGEPIEQAA